MYAANTSTSPQKHSKDRYVGIALCFANIWGPFGILDSLAFIFYVMVGKLCSSLVMVRLTDK